MPKKPQISIRGASYDRVRAYCQERNLSVGEFVDALCRDFFEHVSVIGMSSQSVDDANVTDESVDDTDVTDESVDGTDVTEKPVNKKEEPIDYRKILF